MDNSINEKFQRLDLLIQDDSDLQYLDTQISAQMDAQMKVPTHCPPENETPVSTVDHAFGGGILRSEGYQFDISCWLGMQIPRAKQ